MRQDPADAKAIGPSDPHDLDAGLAPVVAKARDYPAGQVSARIGIRPRNSSMRSKG